MPDVADGTDPVPIEISQADLLHCQDFKYSPSYILPEGLEDDLEDGCECSDGCSTACDCIETHGLFYNESSELLLHALPPSHVLVECGRSCPCPAACPTKLTQRGVTAPLKIAKASHKGLGLFAKESISQGRFICLYAGEYLSSTQARNRWAARASQDNYVLVLNEHSQDGSSYKTIIDPTHIGNVGRFANHSCSPNLCMVSVRIAGKLLPTAALFARQSVQAGDELSFDYGNAGNEMNGPPVALGKTVCTCEAANCRGFLPYEAQL